MREKIEEARKVGEAETNSGVSFSGKDGKPREEDWLRIGHRMIKGQSSSLFMMELEDVLKTLSEDELLTALKDVSGLPLEWNTRNFLISRLVQQLAKTNPEAAIVWLMDSKQEDRAPFSSELFSRWLQSDPQRALEWYDRKLADGAFDTKMLSGRNVMRAGFEGNVIAHLFKSDPAAIADRLRDLPAGMRVDALRDVDVPKAGATERRFYVQLLRDFLSEKEVKDEMGRIAFGLFSGDDSRYARISEFLTQVQATPEEREGAVAMLWTAVGDYVRRRGEAPVEALSGLRSWMEHETPSSVDRITGRAIFSLLNGNEMETGEAVAFIQSCLQKGADPDILIGGCIDGIASKDRDAARALAEKITNPERRATILNQLK
ncbi:MAG: hypothetical protein QM627_00870 [Luteolibacter sp.]